MNYITTTKAEESRAYIWDPRLDGKIKLVGTDEYIRRNPGIARKPFVRPFVVWSTDFKDLRTNEPTGLARFGHIQGVVFKPSGSNRPPRRSPTGTETTGTSDGDDSSSDSGGSTAESVAPSETPSAGTPSLASRVQSSAFAPHGLLGPLTRQHTYTIAYNDLTNPRTSTDLTMGCWLLYSGRGPDYERITSARHRAFEDPEFAASYHLYDWSPLQRSHQLNAHAILETLHEIENFRWDFTTSQGLSADLAFTRALFTRAAFILNSIGLAAWDVVLHNDFRSHDAQRTRFYERHVLQRDTRLRHAWPQLVKYLRASLSRHREAIPFRSPGEPGYRPAERRDGAAGTEVDAINEIHYGWPSNRHLNKLANADCKPILGVGYFSATMRNHRPPLRLSAAPCRARPFAATDVLMNVHRRTTTRKRPRLKRTAPLPPASVISGSTPCTPYEQSYLASLRVCAARMLGFDDVEDPLDVPLFGDGGPSVPHPIARMTDTNRTLRERINDGRICVNLHIAAIDHRRQVLQYLLTKALVDTGAAADVLDGSIADKLPGLRYSNAPCVHLTGFGTDMTAYARIAFIAIKVGPVTIPRKVLVVAPGLMGNTPMLLGLTTLVALNAHIVLDPANWGMTITSPDSSDGERFHVPFRLRASTTAAFWSDWRRTSLDTAPPTKPSPETIKAMVDALLKPSESNPDALPEDRTQLQNLLTQRQHCFAQNINPRELLKYKHSIRLLPGVPAKHLPLYTVPRRLSPPAEKAAKAEIEKLLRDGLIEPSQAGFGSPVVLAPKKDGTMRFCVDYRKLNSLTERDVFPLPRIEDQLERLQGASTFSTGDATSGFWQLELDEESRDLTTFIVPWGMYRWKVTPFGITNGPAAFCRAVTSILGNLLSTCVVAYVDDLTVHSPNVKQHLLDLEAFFAAIDRGNLKLKPSKCRFMVREVELLGFRVSSDGIRMDPKKVEIISKITANELQTVEQLRSFLGLTGFYRRFVQSYARRELSLRDLLTDALRADRLNLVWNDEALAALDDLKKAMCEDIVLMLPDFTKPFIIYTDWSKRAMGAVLMQEDKDGRERPIAFISRTLTNMERKYQSPTEGECIAVLWAVKVWHHYFVCGHPFTIRTDHSALQWLKTQELANNKTLGRAAIALNHYNYTIEYRNGRSNVVADCCSRLAETHAVYKPGGADGTDITTSIPDGAHGFGVPDAGDYDDPRELYRVAIHRTSSALQHTLDGPAWIPTGDRRRATTRPEHLAPAPPRRDRDDPQTSRRRPRSLTPDTQRVRDIVENGGLEDVESQITLERLHENGALSAPDVVPMEVDTPAPAAAADEAGATAPPARRRRGRYRPAGRR
eukprot:tig00000042_g15521.t2